MNNEKLVGSILNELTYAQSILNVIINNNIQADQDLFNTLESVVDNISRAKKSAASIQVEYDYKPIGDIEIIKDQTIEMAVGSILTTLDTAITLKVAEESGHLQNQDEYVINLINSAKLNLDMVYTKVSFPER